MAVSVPGRTPAVPQRRAGTHEWLAVVTPEPPASHSEYVLRGGAHPVLKVNLLRVRALGKYYYSIRIYPSNSTP